MNTEPKARAALSSIGSSTKPRMAATGALEHLKQMKALLVKNIGRFTVEDREEYDRRLRLAHFKLELIDKEIKGLQAELKRIDDDVAEFCKV